MENNPTGRIFDNASPAAIAALVAGLDHAINGLRAAAGQATQQPALEAIDILSSMRAVASTALILRVGEEQAEQLRNIAAVRLSV